MYKYFFSWKAIIFLNVENKKNVKIIFLVARLTAINDKSASMDSLDGILISGQNIKNTHNFRVKDGTRQSKTKKSK